MIKPSEQEAPEEVWHVVTAEDGILWRGYTFSEGDEARRFAREAGSGPDALIAVRYMRAREGGR